jgi:hypothetical protein
MYSFKFFFDNDLTRPVEIFLNFNMLTKDLLHYKDRFTMLEDLKTHKKYLICGRKVTYVEVDSKEQ